MSGVLLLLLSGSIGAIVLGLWVVFRRNLTRSRLATLRSVRAVAEPRPAHRDSEYVSRDQAGAAGQVGVDNPAESVVAPSAKAVLGDQCAVNGEENQAWTPSASFKCSALVIEMAPEDDSARMLPSKADDGHATTPAVIDVSSVAEEATNGFQSEGEIAVLSESDHGSPSEAGQEESLGYSPTFVGYAQPTRAPKTSPGTKATVDAGPNSEELLSPPVLEETRLTQDGALMDVTSQPVSEVPMIVADPLSVVDAKGQDDRDNESNALPVERSTQQHGVDAQQRGAVVAADDLTAHPGSHSSSNAGPDVVLGPDLRMPGTSGNVFTSRRRPAKPARYRDRRGLRRPVPAKTIVALNEAPITEGVLRTPAEARLRLVIHPIRRTVGISVVLARPLGYPDSINLLLGSGVVVGAYGEGRYDDVDLEWTSSLLSGELRLDAAEGYQWLRSGRRIHIFSELADEQGLISVASAQLNSSCAVLCTQEDEGSVRSAAAACGSPGLVSHGQWAGVPDGWVVLSGYRPAHSAANSLDPHLATLDPRISMEIRLSGGLQVRSSSFAEGCPPGIEIEPLPAGAQVTIDGISAEMGSDGCWRAAGWDRPGDHLVDVTPGPSLTYRIVEDPWAVDGWEFWNAHASRFLGSNNTPWGCAQICGAIVSGPCGENVVAGEAMPGVIALGLQHGVAALKVRPDAPVAVGLLREVPAFLISSSGPKRRQGRIDWLAPPVVEGASRLIDSSWAMVVRCVGSRRLSVNSDSPMAQEAWRRARIRARRYRKGEV